MSAEAIRLLLLFGADRTAADAHGRLPVDVLPGGGVGQNGSLRGAVGWSEGTYGRSSFPRRGSERRRSRPGSGSGSRGGNSSSGGSSEGTSPPNEYNGRGGNHSSDDSLGHDDNGLNERGMMNGTTMNGTTMNGTKQSNAGHSSGNPSNEPDAETRLSDDFRMYEFKVRRCSNPRARLTECSVHPPRREGEAAGPAAVQLLRHGVPGVSERVVPAGGRLRVRSRRLRVLAPPQPVQDAAVQGPVCNAPGERASCARVAPAETADGWRLATCSRGWPAAVTTGASSRA